MVSDDTEVFSEPQLVYLPSDDSTVKSVTCGSLHTVILMGKYANKK